jgi:hypothetical protein
MKTILVLIACAFCGFVIANRRIDWSYTFQQVTSIAVSDEIGGETQGKGEKRSGRKSRSHTEDAKAEQNVWSIYTMGEYDAANVDAAQRTIHRVFTFGTRVKGHHRLPPVCVRASNDLDGDQCLNELRKDDEQCIFITNQMIYTEELSVRGLTKLNGNVILLKNNPRFDKVLIHEMGHVLGLRHCENLACVMAIHNDAEGTEKFCEQCIRMVPEGALRNRTASTLPASEVQASSNDVELDDLN